ncbi:alpha-E domain-containing protein [Parasphingorhabdus cellanae]|uniref:Alpha-E domain-containing protein n=1 Tax=Parasphingorhabdus cellanae TaxID=2806553 RepID=A0ABX7T5J9_9SPHN|nr:alpha-E domain-containing protein [Parasphingorhabdus cellanae]QTD56871.1 alpha-E domain-containing protein [Parasphingorhabdus cellanae]
MLGKTAGGLFWMFRYLERSENNARLLDAGFRIALTRSASASEEWKSVLKTAGSVTDYEALHGTYESKKVIDFLLRDLANPSSVISIMKAARDNARLVRTALTREVWEATNEGWITLKELLDQPVPEKDLPDALSIIRKQNALVRGATHGTMLRNDGFHFTQLGTFMERADNTARILDVKYYLLLPSIAKIGSSLDNVQWETILRSVSAQRAYRWLNGDQISPANIAEFLILHRQMPRSLAYCAQQVDESLGFLQEEYGVEHESCRLANMVHQKLKTGQIGEIFEEGLHEYIEGFLFNNSSLGAQIERDYRFQG